MDACVDAAHQKHPARLATQYASHHVSLAGFRIASIVPRCVGLALVAWAQSWAICLLSVHTVVCSFNGGLQRIGHHNLLGWIELQP